ncbi:MAG: tetratricopeptide repeat protein, partial [Burkholderiales bacterium]
ALNGRGDALRALDRDREALQSYREALSVQPDNAQALRNRNVAVSGMLEDAESVKAQDRVPAARASSAEAHCIRGHALDALGRLDEAAASYECALAIRPQHVESLNNLGYVLCKLGRSAEALVAYEKALSLRPADAETHLNLAFARLETGDYERGWAEYEWRWEALHAKLPSLAADKPLWLGQQDVAGKTVIVFAEQGFGDTFQMARYLPLLAARGARVALACHASIAELLRTAAGVDTVFSSQEPPLAFDYHVPIMSLPRAFATVLATIPQQVPYLHPARREADAWRDRLAPFAAQRKIGLVWAGNPMHKRDRVRSIPGELLEPLLASTEAAFFSLQKGDAAKSLAAFDPSAERVADYCAELDTFAHTAALIDALDLVITVDTAVAHLAGALGKPVWILLPFAPDWRWMRKREDSPWYPSARLFRQSEAGDWDSVLRRVADELRAYDPRSRR